MCIILTCEKYVRPDHELIETCFYNNPDGAGLMWVEDDRVCVEKGFTDVASLMDAIDYVPMDSRMVIHMRIATSGGISECVCHPFPVCDRLDALHATSVECSAAMAHNGVIAGVPTDNKLGVSDTVWFIQHYVNNLFVETNGKVTKSLLRRIKKAAPGNRFALMTDDGEVYRMGDGWESVTKGIQASNSSWRYELLWTWDKWKEEEGVNLRWDDEDDWYGYYDGYYDKEDRKNPRYIEAFNFCCGDCTSRATCMAYGPMCSGVQDFIDDYMFYGEEALDFIA